MWTLEGNSWKSLAPVVYLTERKKFYLPTAISILTCAEMKYFLYEYWIPSLRSQWWMEEGLFCHCLLFFRFLPSLEESSHHRVKLLLTTVKIRRKTVSVVRGTDQQSQNAQTSIFTSRNQTNVSEIHSMQLSSEIPLHLFSEEHVRYLLQLPKDDLYKASIHVQRNRSEPTTQIKHPDIPHSTQIPDPFRQKYHLFLPAHEVIWWQGSGRS